MVILMVAVLLGGAGAVLYGMTGENKLPAEHPVFGGTELVPNGYEWTVPVLGEYLERHFTEPANLTVQKLGDLGDAVPELTLPEWAARSELTLTAPDGTIAVTGGLSQGDQVIVSWSASLRDGAPVRLAEAAFDDEEVAVDVDAIAILPFLIESA